MNINRVLKSIFLGIIILFPFFVFSMDHKDINEKNTLIHQMRNGNLSFDERLNIIEKKIIENKTIPLYKAIYTTLQADIIVEKEDKSSNKAENLYKNAFLLLSENKNSPEYIWILSRYAWYNYHYTRDVNKIFKLFLELENLVQRTDEKYILEPYETYKIIGYYLSTIKIYDSSNFYLKKVNRYSNVNHAEIYDNIGMNYYRLNDIKNAEYYFQLGIKDAIKNNNSIRYAKILGNLSEIYIQKKEYQKAKNNLDKAYVITKKENNINYLILYYKRLSLYYDKIGDIDLAIKNIDLALQIAQSRDYFIADEYKFLNEKYRLLLKLGNNKNEEYNVLKKLKEIETKLVDKDSDDNINLINYNYEKKSLNEEIKLKDDLIKKNKTISIFIFSAVILLFLLAFLFYRNRKLENENTINRIQNLTLQLQLDKEKLNEKLLQSNQDIESYISFLNEKNEQISLLKKQASKTYKKSIFDSDKINSEIDKILEFHLMTEENWNSFKIEFIKKYPNYFSKLNNSFKNLTESNLRVILLAKIGLNNDMSANLLGVSYDAIKKAKQRIKKKYNLTHFEDILTD
ncbi:tetratricopeptide repeat protein [Chishuiella sp.]|uniref:tetratricopeptide repeat protein n=1 Tax=Chishuiella sp. TaxID=1969467 RepID=UPI0028AA1B07|nr:tetratricopeptide repeat protein [Chishuiella sp.]